MNRFTHFELATNDLEKTAAFYRDVFGWKVEKWEGPVDYWLVMTGDEKTPGINGGLMQAGGESPAQSILWRWKISMPRLPKPWRTAAR